MASPTKLSANEVAALVGEMIDFDSGGAGENDVEVRPYIFGQNDTTVLSDYYALQMVNERFCRLARNVFLSLLRVQPRVSSFPPELRTFEDYRSGQDNFVSITSNRIDELRGSSLLVIPPGFISLLTDAYYGGTIRNIKPTRNEFTASELRVIEIISKKINEALAVAWRDLVSLTFVATAHEENMQFAQFVESDDNVVICSFVVQVPETDPASFDVIYPLQALKPISSQLRSRLQSDMVDDDESWREQLQRAVMEVPLTLTARLCEPEIPLRQLLGLKTGDVVPVSLAEEIEVLIEGQKFFTGKSGSMGAHAALLITGQAEKKK